MRHCCASKLFATSCASCAIYYLQVAQDVGPGSSSYLYLFTSDFPSVGETLLVLRSGDGSGVWRSAILGRRDVFWGRGRQMQHDPGIFKETTPEPSVYHTHVHGDIVPPHTDHSFLPKRGPL